MLLDVTTVVLSVGLAVAGFIVVVSVTALVLRLIGVVLGDDQASPEDLAEPDAEPGAEPGTGDDGEAAGAADSTADRAPGTEASAEDH